MLYDSILETVGDTPVVRINNLAPDGVRMYVKVEAFNPAASIKDRLALNIIEAAERAENSSEMAIGGGNATVVKPSPLHKLLILLYLL